MLAGTLLFILVLFEKVHYRLKSVCIIWIDYDFIKISIDASAPEDILYSIAYFFLKMLCSLFRCTEMNAHRPSVVSLSAEIMN